MNKIKTLTAIVLALASWQAIAVTAVTAATKPAASAAAPAPYTGKIKKLDRAAIDALLAKPDQLVILDVRRPDELTKIGGFPVYLSIQSTDVEKYLAFIPKDRGIVTVSNHAGRALKVGDLLESKGYKVVGAIGVQNYEEQGGTLTKIAVPPPRQANAAAKAP